MPACLIAGMVALVDKLRAPLFKALGVRSTTLDGVLISTDPRCPVMRPLRSHLFKRTYEAPERAMISAMIEPTDRVLDIGACIGLTAALCAKAVGPENVLAYEANPRLENAIRVNFALNGMVPILRMRAITADGKPVTFHIAKNVFSSSLQDRGDAEAITVPSDALGDVLASFRPTMVLMDAEGAEDELTRGTDFQGVRKLVIETHPHIIGDDQAEAVLARIRSLGFAQTARDGISYAFAR